MMLYAFICLRQYPKHERFVLCAEIRVCIYKILRLTIVASKRYHKKTTIQDLDVELATLKFMVRVSHELKYISDRHYENWQRKIIELGKMTGGWLKSVG
ncbi:diversity-generating retroelement protein Avd [Vibrio toranzoniae]|nr:diversity-generating retroelement protein Avd [Vibrio toranzoniae]NAZ55441.1 diversity-generating retroelement protein Avd [Vibrio toranzoniae]